MKKKLTMLVITLMLLFITSNMELIDAESTLQRIYILSDGKIDPAIVPIQRNGDVYTFIDNVYAQIIVQKDNIIIDGAGYSLQGNYNGTRIDSWVVGEGPYQESNETAPPWTIGIDLANENMHNLTVRNLNIKNFYIGIYLWTLNNSIDSCAVVDNIVGILLSGDSNTITGNYIANNENGIFFGVNQPGDDPLNIVLIHNSFVDNDVHFSGCFCEDFNTTEPVHTWDDGKEGNFWSDYTGVDLNGDGIGDSPYVIDVQNKDRFPLMQVFSPPPTSHPRISIELLISAFVITLTITAVLAIVYKKKYKNAQEEKIIGYRLANLNFMKKNENLKNVFAI